MDNHKSPYNNHRKLWAEFTRKVAAKQDRKIRARQGKHRSIWFGLGLLGVLGWSVVLPTLLGLALGIWIDQQYPSRFSWTLMLMVGGLILGCWNAGHWVTREQSQIDRTTNQSSEEAHHE
ncbi:MAG TPA: AtpZ/AtpI family protein [Coleofasciculaceae cyanobacterium]